VPASITATPAAIDEVPEPSNPGLPGSAVGLSGDPVSGETLFKTNCATCHGDAGKGGVANPGSNDETVPSLNPIDPLLKDPNYNVFAKNIDLFIQHGSVPEGPNPFRTMPGWGDHNAITQQQIADVIAYIISLNK
jgi:mono/diheme cytochrome c family protein